MPRRAKRDTRPKPPRASPAARGYDHRWRKARLRHLAAEPLCRQCQQEGQITPATVVDHVQPPESPRDPLFWDETNWQSLCKSHHDRKTMRQSVRGRRL